MGGLQYVLACHEDLQKVEKATKLANGELFFGRSGYICACAERLPASTPFQGLVLPLLPTRPDKTIPRRAAGLYTRTLSKAVEHARGCVAINIGRFDMVIWMCVTWEGNLEESDEAEDGKQDGIFGS